MIVNVLGILIATEHIFIVHPVPKDFSIDKDVNDKLFFEVEDVAGNVIEFQGESALDIATKMFSNSNGWNGYYSLSDTQRRTALNTAIANLERVREKLIEYWSQSKETIPQITL